MQNFGCKDEIEGEENGSFERRIRFIKAILASDLATKDVATVAREIYCLPALGALLGWTSIFEKTDVNFTNGHHELVWYDSQEKTTRHKLPCKVSCAYFRTPIMDEGNNKLLLYPILIKFRNEKDMENFAASCHMFYSQRVVDINEQLPKWPGLMAVGGLVLAAAVGL
ncbi:hypothetical protein N431DRAFT_527355 [Stipitochalara longipes BDJ]|nr:hypothetical protein N431DRAFT_527355 [Stipitochalara longipes BDJ]